MFGEFAERLYNAKNINEVEKPARIGYESTKELEKTYNDVKNSSLDQGKIKKSLKDWRNNPNNKDEVEHFNDNLSRIKKGPIHYTDKQIEDTLKHIKIPENKPVNANDEHYGPLGAMFVNSFAKLANKYKPGIITDKHLKDMHDYVGKNKGIQSLFRAMNFLPTLLPTFASEKAVQIKDWLVNNPNLGMQPTGTE